MPRKLFTEKEDRDPINHLGHYEKGDGDVMMKKTIRNFGPEETDAKDKRVTINNTGLLKELFDSVIFYITLDIGFHK